MRDAKTLKRTKPEVKYLVKHEGPNRAVRRRAAAKRWIARKRFLTWCREVERQGKDPKRIILTRQLKKALVAQAAKQLTEKVEETASA